MAISLGFNDGSVGSVNYFGNGSRDYPKETLEVFSEGRVLRLENFRRTAGFGFRGFRRFDTWCQDKGHRAEMAAFVKHLTEGGDAPIPTEELVNATLASLAAATAAGEERTIELTKEYGGLSYP
jgi:predicted dehydrogenase